MQLSPHDVRAISVVSHVDPRTIARFLRGESTRPASAAAIKSALAELGYLPANPQPLAVSSVPQAR